MAAKRQRLTRRTAVLAVVSALMTCSLVTYTSPAAVAQGGSWVQTTLEDFASGTGTNVDSESSPGSVRMEASLSTWIESSYNPGLRQGASGSWDDSGLTSPVVLKDGGVYKMWYAGDDTGSGSFRMGYAVSLDGANWTKPKLGLVSYGGSTANNLVMDLGPANSSDSLAVVPGTILREPTIYHLWYSCYWVSWAVCYANSTDGFHWQRHSNNPVLNASAPSRGVVAPTVYGNPPGYSMQFSQIDEHGRYILRSARSPDGLDWNLGGTPFPPDLGEAGSWYDGGIIPGSYEMDGGSWRMWYAGVHGSTQSIAVRGSVNGSGTTNPLLNPVLGPGASGTWDSASLSRPCVLRDGSRYRMWFAGFDGTRWAIGSASSAFGERMVPPRTNPVLNPGTLESWDSGGIFRPSVMHKDGRYYMWYTGSGSANGSGELAIGLAMSTDGVNWIKRGWQPVFKKNGTGWDSAWVGFAWVIWDNNSKLFKMWYSGSDNTSVRLGLATSFDGAFWTRNPSNPITFVGDLSWFNSTAVSCPWIGEESGGNYIMFVGTRNGSKVSIARAHSWDNGLTWGQYEPSPFLSPLPGTWESASVSCPMLITNRTGQTQWMWYEGSRQASLPGFGEIGVLTSTNWGNNFSRSSTPVMSATKLWDVKGIGGPTVVDMGSHMRMFIHGGGDSVTSIGTAVSYDGINWHETFVEPAIYGDTSSAPSRLGLSYPVVIEWPNQSPFWLMYCSHISGGERGIGFSTTNIYGEWSDLFGVSISGGSPGGWDSMGRKPLSAVTTGTTYDFWYSGLDNSGVWSIGHATAIVPGDWQADPANPVIAAGPPGTWDSEGVDGASVIHPGLTYPYEMWYSGFDGTTWRIGFAYSDDGTAWTKSAANPVLYPSSGVVWDSQSVFKPSIIIEGGIYHMLYSGYDGVTWSLGQAFSKNGISWVKSKLNPILGGSNSNKDPIDTKDASIQMIGQKYRVWFSDSDSNNSAISHVESAFLSTGTFLSKAIDTGIQGTTWTLVNVTKSVRSNADVSVSVKADMPPYLDKWLTDSWAYSHALQDVRGRNLKYRLTFVSLTGEDTPVVDEVSGWYIPNQGPMGIPTSPADGSCTNQNRPVFKWTYSDPEGDYQRGFTFQVAEDENFTLLYYSFSLNTDYTVSGTPYPLSDGMWFWRVQLWDLGTFGPWSPPTRFCVDTVPPSTQMNMVGPHAGVAPAYISGSTGIWLNLTDTGCGRGTTFANIDGLNWAAVNEALMLSPGYHSVEFYSVDDAGNSEGPRTETFFVDVSPPNTTLLVGGNNVLENGVMYVRGDTSLLLDATDSESGPWLTQYSVDSVSGWTNGPVVMPLTPGLHTLYYRSFDLVGNAEITKSQQIFMDTDGPTTSIRISGAQVPGSPVFVTPATLFNLTTTDAGAGVGRTLYRLDADLNYSLYAGDFSIASEGLHVLKYYSEDRLGNPEPERTLLLQVDRQGPATYVSPLGPSYITPTGIYVMSSTVMLIAGSDDGSGLQAIYYSLNGGPWTRYSMPFNLSATGHNSLSFYGVDVLGTIEPVNVVDLYVDEEPPLSQLQLTGTVVQTGGLTYVDQGTTASLQATDAGSGTLFVRYRLDGSSWSVYGAPFPLIGSGDHTIDIQAVDNLGISETLQTFLVVVDAGPPTANAGRDIASFAPKQVFLDATSSFDDTTIVSYEWTAEGNGSVVLRSAKGMVDLQSPGAYTFILRVRDPLGRESTDTVVVRLLEDPDSDRDLLPDVWETSRFGNLTYGPGDDPDANGLSNLEEYGQQGAIDTGGDDGETKLRNGDNQGTDAFLLFILTLLGILIGLVVLQWLKVRELKRKLGDKEAETSISFDDDEVEDSRHRGSER